MNNQKKNVGLSITAMVLGIIGLLLTCVYVGGFLCVIGLIFAIIAMATKAQGKGMAIAGLVTSIVGIVFFVIILIMPKDTTETTKPNQEVQNEQNDVNDNTNTDAIDENSNVTEPSDTETDSSFAIGEEAVLDDWSITISSAETTDKIYISDYFSYSPDEEDSTYIAITLTVTNNGTESDTFLPSISFGGTSAKLYYQTDYEYTSSWLTGYSDDMHNCTLNPLSSKTGVIAFSVPNSVATSTEELILRISAGSDHIDFKIR